MATIRTGDEMIRKRLAALINVKTLVTFAVTGVFVILALRGDIGPSESLVIITTVIGFYFGTQKQKMEEESEVK